MKARRTFFAGLALVLLFAGRAKSAEAVPDGAETRKAVDALIQNAADHRATLGLLHSAMELSISFGAPAWNNGDHDACSRFYVKTAESLCAAFAPAAGASDLARPLLNDLQSAVQSVKNSNDADANAWAMRYVFDKTEIVLRLQSDRSMAMTVLGRDCQVRSSFTDSANAYRDSLESLRELQPMAIEQIPILCRYAPFGLSDTLFAQRKYAEATAAIQEGMKFIPDWALQADDERKHFENPALYNLLMNDLKSAAEAKPDDASIQFLYGYHLYFTGRHDLAKPYLQRAQKLDPKLTAANLILNPPPREQPAEPKTPPTQT